MIAAQIMPIIALFISWIWWVTVIIGIIGFIVYQTPWCCRQNRGGMLCSGIFATIIGLTNIGVGIFFLVRLRDSRWCEPFVLWYDTYNSWPDDDWDGCREKTWGTIALVCGFLWLATASCVFYFVGSGRHAKWEKYHSHPGSDDNDNDDNAGAVELGIPAVEEGEPVVVAAAAEVVTPEISKVDSTE